MAVNRLLLRQVCLPIPPLRRWCEQRDLNPHDFRSQASKTCASANSAMLAYKNVEVAALFPLLCASSAAGSRTQPARTEPPKFGGGSIAHRTPRYESDCCVIGSLFEDSLIGNK